MTLSTRIEGEGRGVTSGVERVCPLTPSYARVYTQMFPVGHNSRAPIMRHGRHAVGGALSDLFGVVGGVREPAAQTHPKLSEFATIAHWQSEILLDETMRVLATPAGRLAAARFVAPGRRESLEDYTVRVINTVNGDSLHKALLEVGVSAEDAQGVRHCVWISTALTWVRYCVDRGRDLDTPLKDGNTMLTQVAGRSVEAATFYMLRAGASATSATGGVAPLTLVIKACCHACSPAMALHCKHSFIRNMLIAENDFPLVGGGSAPTGPSPPAVAVHPYVGGARS